MSSLELSCQQFPRRSLFISIAPGLRAKEKAFEEESFEYILSRVFLFYLVKTGAGPGWREAPPDSLHSVLIKAVVEDGVHIAPLVRPVEDNLVVGRAKLGTLRLVASLHVVAANILNVLYLLLPHPAPLPDVAPRPLHESPDVESPAHQGVLRVAHVPG